LPPLGGLLDGIALTALGQPIENTAVGVTFGVTFGLAGSFVIAIAASVAAGVAVLVIGVMVSGVAVGLAGGAGSVVAFLVAFGERVGATLSATTSNSGVEMMTVGMAIGMAIGVAYGLAGSVAGNVAREAPAYSFIRQIGSICIGTLIGSIAVGISINVPASVALGVTGVGLTGMAFAVAGGMALGLRTHSLPRALIIGVAGGAVFGLAFRLGASLAATGAPAMGVALGAASGVALGTWVSGLFVLNYILIERIAGPWAGSVSAALGSAGSFLVLWLAMGGHSRWLILVVVLVCCLVGLTAAWWQSLVLYPFLSAWNLLLYRTEIRRHEDQPNLLRWHSAFWDEHQSFPLIGLEDHLVLVMERSTAEGNAALAYLSTGPQRWATQAAQIELDARRLEHCADVTAIGTAHYNLAAGELTGPASALLRSFGRISRDAEAALHQESNYNRRLALSAVEDRLDGLLRELTRSSERYAIRFQPIAAFWRRIVNSQLQTLTQEAELRQEIVSPYIVGLPLTAKQEIFVGRADVNARIEGLLLERSRAPLLLYGQRRMGKTSLLNNLGRLLPSSIVPLFVDLQGPASRAFDHTGFLYNIARGMGESARQHRERILPPLAREMLAVDPFTVFDEWLDEVEACLGQDTALLALDELEALDSAISRGRFEEEAVLGMLRHLIQHRPRFKVLLAGSHTLEELHRWASYLINVQVVHLSYLREAEALKLVEQPVKDFALRYEPGASQRVLDLTRGHPFLVQLLCAETVALKNEQPPADRRLARVADVEAAASDALSRGSFFFADIEHNQVDASGSTLLRFLAAQGEGVAVGREALVNHSAADPDPSVELLLRRELIEPAGDNYRFQVELIRRWFAL
jgi:hypothetical protein